jgi:hypothetical protein
VSDDGQSPVPCPYCGATAPLVHVHGHGQCAHCGANTEPCCGGASADEVPDEATQAARPDPGLFPRLFLHLGGPDATVTTASLLQAIVQSQQCDLDEAALVLEAGERIGLIVRVGPDWHRLRSHA